MEIIDFIQKNSDKGSLIVLMGALLIAARWFWKEHQRMSEAHKTDIKDLTSGCEERLSGLTKQLFDVIDKNTQAFTRHTESVHRNTEVSTQLKERLNK